MLRFSFKEYEDGVYYGCVCIVSAHSLEEALDTLGDGENGYTYKLFEIEINEED